MKINNYNIERIYKYSEIFRLNSENELLPSDIQEESRQLLTLLKELEKSQQELQIISETSIDVIFRISMTGKISFITQSCKDLLGYKINELIGQPFSIVVPKDNFDEYFKLIQKLFKENDREQMVWR